MNRKLAVFVSVVALVFSLAASPAAAGGKNSHPRKKGKVVRVVKRAATWALIGAAGGALGNRYDRVAGALRGATAGAVIAAGSAATEPEPTTVNGGSVRGNPYNKVVAPATAKASATADASRPIVVVRDVDGADYEPVANAVAAGLAKKGYATVDVRKRSSWGGGDAVAADFLLDVTVREIGRADSDNQGDWYSRGVFSRGRRVVGGGRYRVSISMVDARTSLLSPERSATQEIEIVLYEERDRDFGVVIYDGSRYETRDVRDPETEAATWAVEFMFELR